MSGAKEVWEELAGRDPYYAVSTFEKFRGRDLDATAKDEFFESGWAHVERLWNEFESVFGMQIRPRKGLDYGCGVGRILLALTGKCESVVGVDISAKMLDETRKNASELGISNVELQDAAEFFEADSDTYDFVHSYIVLQHVDPKIGNELIGKMLKRLETGGLGMIQVTYFDPAAAMAKLKFRVYRDLPLVHKIQSKLRGKSEPLMPMYEYDLNKIFAMLNANGCGSSFVRFSDHGWPGVLIFFQKDRVESF